MRHRYTRDTPLRSSDSIVWKQMSNSFENLDEHTILSDEGYLVWCPSTTGAFTLSSTFEVSRHKFSSLLSSAYIWKVGFLLKASTFLWRLLRYCYGFLGDLHCFGLHLPSVFPFCMHAEATPDHCLLSRSYSSQDWEQF